MQNKHYILFDLKSGKQAEIKAKEDCQYLDYLSCLSRGKQRPFELIHRIRESKTIKFGTPYTAIPVGIDIVMNVYRITDQYSLLTLAVVTDGNAGTPAAAAPSTEPPNPHAHRASGYYRVHTRIHRKPTRTL